MSQTESPPQCSPSDLQPDSLPKAAGTLTRMVSFALLLVAIMVVSVLAMEAAAQNGGAARGAHANEVKPGEEANPNKKDGRGRDNEEE